MRRWGVMLLVAIALTLLVGRWASMVYANWQWYDALGALSLYRSELAHEAAWRFGAGGVAFAFAFLNLYALRRSIISLVLPRRIGNLDIGEAVPGPILLAVVIGIAVVLAVFLSALPGDWTTFAFARFARPFREMDPYLDRDLSYLVAWLPFELELHDWATLLLVVVGALIVALYALTPSLRLRRGGIYVSAYCRRHLATLAAMGLLVLAWGSRLDGLSMTSLGADAIHPFGAYGFRIGLAVAMWTSLLTAVAAFLVLWAGWHGYARVAAVAGLVACVGGPLVGAALPGLSSRARSEVDRREQDRPFAATRRRFTRRAFGVDAIVPAGESSTDSLGVVGASLPSWDPAAILRAVAGASSASQRHDLAWTTEPALQAIAIIGPRAGESPRWYGERIEATTTDDRGRVLSALPPAPPAPAVLAWDAPLVFEGAEGGLVVSDTSGHIPAPRFASFVERLAHAWNLRSPRLLMSTQSPLRPRVVFRRDVRDRIAALAPFLTAGPTVAPLVRGDSLYWSAELFTTAAMYPLSERLMFAGVPRAYVHHAATAYVNAQTGRVLLVAAPEPDAIMRAWMRRFPELFVSLSGPLAASRAPAVDWAGVQATALARTGLGDSPISTRAALGVDNADADLADAPPMLHSRRGFSGALAWSVPLVDAEGIVTGVLRATGGAYERTVWHPAARADRWSEVLDRLQRTADSAGFGRQRRNPRRGRVLVVPLTGGLLYAQAHYEWPSESAPVLAGVATEYAGVTRAGQTLGVALGGVGVRPPAGDSAFRARVNALHRRMADALRRGDWVAFGAAFDALGQLLRTTGR